MSLNMGSFEYVGGAAGQGIWRYSTTDNVASLALGTADGTYFADLPLYVPGISKGDMIDATNGSTPTITRFLVSAVEKASTNKCSVIPLGRSVGDGYTW